MVASVVLTFIVLVALSTPIVFALGLSGMVGLVLGNFSLQKLPSALVAGSQSWVLLAVPTFVFAGSLMERCGMSSAPRNLAPGLVGRVRGGLRISGWPKDERPTWASLSAAGRASLVPLVVPVVIVLGFFFGVFTATEAGALVAAYAMAAAFFYYRNVTLREMWGLLHETALLTAAVIFLLAVASIYQFLMGMLGVPAMLGEALRPLESTPWLFLLAVSILVMLFGMVLEGLPAAVVLIPVVFPISKQIGIHPVHFATVLTAAVGIGLFLPPIGVGLLMALRFADISVGRHFKAYWPYLLSLFVGLLILILFPELTLFLPRRAGLVR